MKLPSILIGVMMVLLLASSASAAWWNSDYAYKLPAEINNTAGQALTNYQINVSIPSGINATSIRVVNETAGATVYHWCENITGGNCYELWFNATHIPAGAWCNDTYAIYYGNDAISSTSDYDNTFTKTYNTTGLVLELHMDEGTGFSQTNDTSGEGNHGTLTNMNVTGNATSGWQGTDGGQWDNRSDMVFATGDQLRFDGEDDYVFCGNDGSLNISEEITVLAWIKRNNLADFMEIVAKHNSYKHFRIESNNNIMVQLYFDDASNTGELEVSGISTLEWHYVAFSFSTTTGKTIIYKDGTALQTWTGYTGKKIDATGESVYVGKNKYSSVDFFDGSIDEVRIYNRALSEDEIYRQYIHSKYAVDAPTATIGEEEVEFEITLHSVSPETIHTNHTGAIQVNYIVKSTNPLNLSSLAMLYGINYTTTGDMHSYVAAPANSIASDGIYRAPYRNTTPYLSWEDNATITEGNVWQWGGGDNNSTWITKTPINATHTWINATGYPEHIFQGSFYLGRRAMETAPKTAFEVNLQQGLIIKMWDNEAIRGRTIDYLMNMYFDSDWESTIPTSSIEIWGLNSSFNPDTDDPTTSEFGAKIVEWDGNRWINHSWVPDANASYSYPLVFDASSFPVIPDETNYIYLKSGTQSSKSYVLNATNHDPDICNRTFAQTETMWTYNELSDVSDQVAYTPSFFTTFVRDDEQFLHHLYIADDQGLWAHSDINNISIGVSHYPVEASSFDYFNITCPTIGHTLDTGMGSTYDNGYMHIGIYCHADPDGGTVSHNITIHYVNETLAGIINNTFQTTSPGLYEINFTTSPYYSTTDAYVLKCVSTDDEGSAATTWLDSFFTLAADGTQGYYVDDYLMFWGMNDIPTLYSTVANNSLISYDAGSDIYTMHVPFFKSKCNDTFRFNETVHLKSLNTEDVAYFRFGGETIFDSANVHGWNTVTDTPAPSTDAYRGYMVSCCRITTGNITNSNLSYLGSDVYQQEGLNFIGNTMDYLIYNTTLSNNSRGIIMEECENFNISHCNIHDNAETGIGVYYSNSITVENCSISDSAYDPGLYLYESGDNIIRHNTITDCSGSGMRIRSNSNNNTLTGNDITGSGIYDYYFSSAAINNTIRNPASATDKIRVTSTSEVNIENTDNAVFEEDSSNSTYAYPTNFSMSVTGLSHTFDITQRNMTITPETDNVRIRDLNWTGINVTLNASSSAAGNHVWFNITKPSWESRDVSVYRNGITFYEGIADASGTFEYNYTGGWSEWYFTFAGTPEVEPVTNLHPTTRIHNKIVWAWVNPDSYDTIMVYLDNTWMQNTTGTAYSASGLAQTTSYTIKLITVHEGTESVSVTDTQITPAEGGGSGGGGGVTPTPTPTPTPTATPTPTPTPLENVTENATIVIEPIPEITEEITSDYIATGSVWHLSFDKHLVFIPEHRNIIACDAMPPYACRYYEYQERFEIVIDGESPDPVFAEDQWVTFITRDGKKINQRIQTKVYNPLFYFTMPSISGSVGDISRYFVHGDEYVVDGVRFWWIGLLGAGLIAWRWKKQ